MALKPCRECGVQVSSEAKACPSCGINSPLRKPIGCAPLVVVFVGVLIFVGVIGSSGDGPQRPATSIPQVGSKTTMAINGFACSTESVFDRLRDYANQNDDQAFRTELLKGVMLGDCIYLKKGDPVVISEVSVWHGVTKIRPFGKTQEYWTFTSSVTP